MNEYTILSQQRDKCLCYDHYYIIDATKEKINK